MNWRAVIEALRERATTIRSATDVMKPNDPAKIVGGTANLVLMSLAEALEVGTRTPTPRPHGYGPGWES